MTHILIVEDDPMVSMLNTKFAEQVTSSAKIKTVSTIQEAKNELQHHTFDLLLLDIYLPGGNGINLLQWMREKHQQLFVILITAANDTTTLQNAVSYGVIDYLIKPFTFERFKLAIEKFLEFKTVTSNPKKIDQTTIDTCLNQRTIYTTSSNMQNALPKGLSDQTLKKIYYSIISFSEEFSTKDLSKKVGLSRISTKKYIDFLTEIGALHEEIMYLDVGRPVGKYQLTKVASSLIKKYVSL